MCEYTYKLTFCDASWKTLSVQFTRFGFLHLPSESHNLVAVPYQKYRLGFNWSLTYLQSICLSTKTEMVINITYINIYSWLYKYLFDFQNKVFLLLCLQSLYSIECPLPSQYYTLFFLQLTFMVFIYFNVATMFIILVASNKSCAFKIQKFSVTYWKVISR